MVVGELVPKNWAISRPLAVAKVVAGPQRGFTAAFAPFIRHLNNTANRFVRRFGLEPAEELASARSPGGTGRARRALRRRGRPGAGLRRAVRPHPAPGRADRRERHDSARRRQGARSRTPPPPTPRTSPTPPACPASPSTATAWTRSSAPCTSVTCSPSSRTQRAVTPVTELATEPLLVPDSLTADRLLERMRAKRTMAVVIDEYGGTAGVATVEDIVEEVVGEVRDEHDPRRDPRPARAAGRRPRDLGGGRQRPHRPARRDRAHGARGAVRDRGRTGRHPARTHPRQGRRPSTWTAGAWTSWTSATTAPTGSASPRRSPPGPGQDAEDAR